MGDGEGILTPALGLISVIDRGGMAVVVCRIWEVEVRLGGVPERGDPEVCGRPGGSKGARCKLVW